MPSNASSFAKAMVDESADKEAAAGEGRDETAYKGRRWEGRSATVATAPKAPLKAF